MLKRFKCPHCRKTIETDQVAGVKIACPYCEEEFALRATDEVRPSAARDAAFRLAIPIGYVLFVALPLGLTIWFFANRAERQEREAAEARDARAEDRSGRAEEGPPPRAPAPPRRKRPDPADAPPVERPVGPPKRDEVPAPVPPVKEPREVAPAPREVPEIEVAPPPREIVWKLPPMDYVSPWQTVGAIDLRVAGVAVTPVPLVDVKEQVRESATPMLVVVVEVRMNTATKKRQLAAWALGQVSYAAGFLAGGRELSPIDLPLGTKVNSGVPRHQPITHDGRPARDVLVFVAPPSGAGELSLRLDGTRAGEPTDIWFKIPPTAWKK